MLQLVRETKGIPRLPRIQAFVYWSIFIHRKQHDSFNVSKLLHHLGTNNDRHWWIRQVNEKRKLELCIDRQGRYKKFLGIEITQLHENVFKIYQPFLIDGIISFINIDTNNYGMNTNAKSTPVDKPLLHKDLYWNLIKEECN